PLGESGLGRGKRRARIAAGAVDQPGGEPFRVVEQDFQKMFRRELLVPLALRKRLGGLHETAAAVGVFVEIHWLSPSAYSGRPDGTTGTSSLGYMFQNLPPAGHDQRQRRRG